jgi:hypothetical protein
MERAVNQESPASGGIVGAVALLRRASETIRSATDPQDALAEAAVELADALSFIAEAMTTQSSVGHDARRDLLAEALSCTRAAASVVRFAVVRADDEARLGNSAPSPESTPGGSHTRAEGRAYTPTGQEMTSPCNGRRRTVQPLQQPGVPAAALVISAMSVSVWAWRTPGRSHECRYTNGTRLTGAQEVHVVDGAAFRQLMRHHAASVVVTAPSDPPGGIHGDLFHLPTRYLQNCRS